jgi:hypothetical protein
MNIPSAFLSAASMLMLVASPQTPVAVVESVTGSPAGIQFMDYVDAGKVIKLAPEDSIVLGYLMSCAHETITGGTVIVGSEHSEVVGGKLERTIVPCGGGKIELTAEIANKSAAMAFRELPQNAPHEPPRPQLTLYGRSPVVEVRPIGALIIERVDRPGEHYDVILPDAQLVHGKFLDLTTAGVVLDPGGVYRARVGMQEIVFKIDHEAKAGQTPIAGRLLRLQPMK